MLLTYVGRELRGRKRQTLIVALGLALAIALVLVVNSASAGVRNAQNGVLQSVYGVGTDITVTKTAAPGSGGGQRFAFGANDGTSGSGTTQVASDNLGVAPGSATLAASAVSTVQKASGVSGVTATLVLRDTTFNGSLPETGSTASGGTASSGSTSTGGRPSDAAGGFHGGDFDVNSFTVEGITPGATALGPLSGAAVSSGRGFTAADTGKDVALISTTYATSKSLKVGSTLTIKGTTVTVVGVLGSSSSSTSLSDVYLPLDVAQQLSGLTGDVTNLYVQADSSGAVTTAAAAVKKALPGATVSTEADLAAGVTGSLSSASSLIGHLGRWLSIGVLAAAFVLAVLFTISGVSRRTRDFGTLKAIGWSNLRIVRQVGVESVVQGVLGGVLGLVVGLGGIYALNAAGITLSGATGGTGAAAAAPSGSAAGQSAEGAFGGGPGRAFAGAATKAVDVVLHAPVDVAVVALGIGLAIAGGLLAGVVGGWRASRLRPAAALRSLD